MYVCTIHIYVCTCTVDMIGSGTATLFFFNIIGAITRQKLDRKVIMIQEV